MTPFIEVVNQLNILPEVFVIPFAALLPPLELVLGILLIVGYLIRFSSIMIMGLLLLMLAAIFPQLLGGPKIDDCGCFGGIMDSAVDIFLIVRDMIIIVIVYIIFNQEKHILALDNQFGQFDRREQ
jgi:hypothetical protein